METLSINDLSPQAKLTHDLYDAATATRLLKRGETLTGSELKIIRNAGITKVALLSLTEGSEKLIRQARFREIDIYRIDPGTVLGYDVYSPDGGMLLRKGTELDEQALRRIARRGVKTLFIKRAIDPIHTSRVKQALTALRRERTSREVPKPKFDKTEMLDGRFFLTERTVRRMAQDFESRQQMSLQVTEQEALQNYIRIADALEEREDQTKDEYRRTYQTLVNQVSLIYSHMRRSQTINGSLILNLTDQVVSALVKDRDLLLGCIYMDFENIDYLAQHAVNVAILCINIAAAHGCSVKQVTEVGFSALLADIGMLKVPDEIRFKKERLSQHEHLEVMRHTLYGIDSLQLVDSLPTTVPLVAFQSHERLDGTGYPHGKRAPGIHDYAKIYAIADIYHAQISRRPFRPHGILPYRAVEEILKLANAKKLDSRFVRNMLSVTSLFPVGSWVRLNTGEIGRVLSASRDEYTRPIVAVIFDETGKSYTPPRRIDLRENRDLNVVAPAQIDQLDPMVGF